LCFGISLACGYPLLAGMFAAITAALVATFISNSVGLFRKLSGA
jgi:hypothetical protein